MRSSVIGMIAAFALIALGGADQAWAHRSPKACTTNGPGSSITIVFAAGAIDIKHGDEICIRVDIIDTCAGCCDVTLLDTELVMPDGSIVPITAGASVPFGDSFTCPSADTRCASPSTCTLPGESGYKYIMDHADEHGHLQAGCPPNPPPGSEEVSAFLRSTAGTVHTAPLHGFANICQTGPIPVGHACCEPCTGTCTNVLAEDCPFPSVFTPDKSCDEVTCTRLDCSGLGNQCNEARCNPATGSCESAPRPFSTPCEAEAPPNLCTIDHCDGLGNCVLLSPRTCPGPVPPCEAGAFCNPLTGNCVDNTDPPLSTPCNTDNNLCTREHCNGIGSCVPMTPPLVVCQAPIPPCERGELCNPATGLCVQQNDAPLSTPCEAENPPNLCTNDHCDGQGRCVLLACKPPRITCPPDRIFECDAVGDFGDPTVEDECSANATVECTEESTPGKLPQERTIIRTCTVTSGCGSSAQCEQRVDIVDSTEPDVTCPPDCTLECGDVQCAPPECDDPDCECGGVATCEDNCSTCTVSVSCEVVPKDCTPGQAAGLTPSPKLTVVRTYTGTDAAAAATATGQGNIGTCVQRIEIVDSIPPVLDPGVCSTRITICAGTDLSFTPPTCTDACGSCEVICVRSDNLPFAGPPPIGPITVTCVASDDCGNESSCDVLVELSDGDECIKVIPTMSEWGLVVLTLLLLIGAKVFFGGRQVAVA